jgi:hypothetical protein
VHCKGGSTQRGTVLQLDCAVIMVSLLCTVGLLQELMRCSLQDSI